MLINMVKVITTRSGMRNTTLVEGTKEQPPLKMDITPQGQRSVKKLQAATVRITQEIPQ